ncbi:MAG TPA: class E sortase [Gaiellaceae bacterium]|nr:class E sortase [Gaiellaceae bacterium]
MRRLGTLLVAAGIGVLAWSATVYLWKDPFTTLYTAYEQRRLEDELDRRLATWRPAPQPPPRPRRPRALPDLRADARRYRRESAEGEAIARLVVPRLGLDVVVVNGTDPDDLRRGPGRHLETAMPGERALVYVAGHRTTFGAPFSDIDRLRAGDRITLEVPYARLEYRVVRHRIVDDNDLSVLRSRGREELVLQACHPRFFSSQRYLVYARPVRVTALGRSG